MFGSNDRFRLLTSAENRFAIPFMFSTTLGLAAVALGGDPAMRTLTPADVSAGLAAPSAAAALLGKSGAAAVLIVLFLAVTSATSAELIAVSSILTYDLYKVTIHYHETRSRLMRHPFAEIHQPQSHRGSGSRRFPWRGNTNPSLILSAKR